MKQYHLRKLLPEKVTTIVDVIGKREAVIHRMLPLSCARVRQLCLLDSLLYAPTHLVTAVVLSNTIKGALCISRYYTDIRMTLIHL